MGIPLEKCKSGEVLFSAEFIPLAMVQQQKGVEPIIAAEQINETVPEVDFHTKEKRKEKAPEDKTSEVAIVQQQKVVEKLIAAETIKESSQEVKLVPKEKNKEKATQEKTLEPVVETKPVCVSPPQKTLEAGQVVITVYKARDIEQKGMFGKADPYVKMTLGNQEAKSATVKNNYNPEWNFKATFDVNQNTTEYINISVFDDDFGKDDSLGSTLLDISKVQEHKQLLNQWIPLEKCKSGEVLLSAEFIPQGMIQQQSKVETLIISVPIKEPVQEADVEAEEVKNEMLSQEKTPELVVETPDPIKETIHEAGNKTKENAPEVKTCEHTKDIAEDLILEPMELKKEVVSQGKTQERVVQNKETICKVDLKPNEKTKDKVPQGKTLEPVVETSPPQKPLEAGQIIITVYRAKDIEKKGMLGKADPYVKLTLGKQKAKSGTVKNNHNPDWNFKAIFYVDQNSSEGINIEVFDDDFGKDDSLGNTLLDICKVQEHQKLLNQWIPLEKCKSGAVLISAEFIPLEKIQKQKEVEPTIAAESKNENIQEVDTEEIKDKVPPEIAIKQQKDVEPIIEADKIQKTLQEVDLEPNEKTKQKPQQQKTPEPVVEKKTVPVSTLKKTLEAGQVVITIYKARDIEKKGMFGKADPYVKLTLGEQKAKSATVKNNHNPEWNFKATFDVDHNTAEGIDIAVFDDDFGKDESLGSTFLDLSKVHEHQQLLNQWTPLEKCKSGEVLLSAEFIPLIMVKQQKEVEPLIAAEPIKETKPLFAAGSIKETVPECD